MKKIFLSFLIILLFSNYSPAQEGAWNVEKSTHFIVYYKNSPADFIKQVLSKSEDYYLKITEELGFRRFDFWLWDNRAKIYIYDNSTDYQAATSLPAWSAGSAQVKEKTIRTFPYAQGFFESILAHEMGHIIFREFVGFDNYAVPLWLDEGVASYQQKDKYLGARGLVKRAMGDGSFFSLSRLTAFASSGSMDNDTARLFYAESFSLIDFLIKGFGRERFVFFCQNLRDKKSLEKAIVCSYPFQGLSAFEEAWKKDLINNG